MSISVLVQLFQSLAQFLDFARLGGPATAGQVVNHVPIFGGSFGDFAHVGRHNIYRSAGDVHSERGRYAALKGWVAVQIDAELFVKFSQKGAHNLCFFLFV